MPDNFPDLAKLVQHIRRELETVDLQRQAAGKVALFVLSSLELELNFTVTQSEKSKGGLSLQIISAGVEGSYKAEEVHKVKIVYTAASQGDRGGPPGTRGAFPESPDITPLR